MLSDDELLDGDASDSIFAKDILQEDSPTTFTHHLINRLGISSKEGTETQSLYRISCASHVTRNSFTEAEEVRHTHVSKFISQGNHFLASLLLQF